MADSKLRLSIQTALDNAGIKATQEQIQGLEQSLTKANNNFKNSSTSTLTGVNKGINAMQHGVKTFMKDVAIAAGATKLIGTAMKEMYEEMIGNGKSFSEAFSSMWSNMADRMRKAFFGTSVREIWDGVSKQAEESAQHQIDAQNRIISKLDEAKRKINDETIAYINQKDAVTKLKRAGSDSEVLRLTREKIMQSGALRDMGDDAGAEQLEKLYDYLIEQRTSQNELDFAQAEIDKASVKWQADEKKMKDIQASLSKMATRLSTAETAWKKVGQEIEQATAEVEDESIKESMAQKISQARMKEYQAAQRAYKKLEEQYDKQLQVLGVDGTESATLWQKLENARLQADIRMNEKSKAWNDSIDENGNLASSAYQELKNERWAPQKMVEFYKDLSDDISTAIEQMNQTYEKTFYRDEGHYDEILQATVKNGEMLEKLLQLK